jgi:uncharacterized protein
MEPMTEPTHPASPPHGPRQPIASPCIKVCAVDGPSGLCCGCGRSLSEIAGWALMSPAERTAVMEQLPERLKLLNERLGARAGGAGGAAS